MFVQALVIDLGNKQRVVIEKMHFLLAAHGDVRVSAQKIMQGRGPGFLRAGQNEIQPVDLFRLGLPHGHESRTDKRIAQLLSRQAAAPIIGDLSCNAERRFAVLSNNGRCFEGVNAWDVDFLRDPDRCSLHCLARSNRRHCLSKDA